MQNSKTIALHLALQELRHGWRHFIVFAICLVLGITVITTVNSFGALIENAMESESQSLLGGDAEITLRGIPATKAQVDFLKTYGKISRVSTLRSMLHAGEESTLVELKAVDDAYPLLGTVELNEPLTLEEALSGNGLAVDSILLAQMALNIGDTVQLGEAEYTIRATLKKEPDRVVHIFSFGPKVILSHASLEASGMVNTFSLINHHYRLLSSLSLNPEALEEKLEKELKQRFPDTSWRVQSGTDGNRTVSRFLSQMTTFLMLAGISTLLIGGIGIGGSVRAYLERKIETIAVLKTLGATRKTIFTTYLYAVGILALVAGSLGVLAGVAAMYFALPLAIPYLPVLEKQGFFHLPSALLSLWCGFLIAYLFSMPALLGTLRIKPGVLFRSKSGNFSFALNRASRYLIEGIGLLLFLTLVLTAKDRWFMTGAASIALLAFFLFDFCNDAIRYLAKKIKVDTPWLQLALSNLHRPGATTGTVIFAIGISLTVLICLTLTEANFQHRIKAVVEEKAPSLFMIDIQPDQKALLEALLQRYAEKDQMMMMPMVRGRIAQLNGKDVTEDDVDDDVRWAVRGDRGISYSHLPPPNATIVEGKWWPEGYSGKPLISVDERFMGGMNLSLNDTITLNILGQDIVATVASARDIDYTTFQINFAMMLSPGVLESLPQTFLATVHLPETVGINTEAKLVREIATKLPSVTVIRTSEVVALVREVLHNISLVLRLTVGISLLAGLIVLVSALSATLQQRLYDTAVLKVLGARKAHILKMCLSEWMLLALATSFIAIIMGSFSAWLILQRFRGQDFVLMPEVVLGTVIACILIIWLTGFLGNRKLFNFRPIRLLRNE